MGQVSYETGYSLDSIETTVQTWRDEMIMLMMDLGKGFSFTEEEFEDMKATITGFQHQISNMEKNSVKKLTQRPRKCIGLEEITLFSII